jgi:Zn-dependent protease with chaperone function
VHLRRLIIQKRVLRSLITISGILFLYLIQELLNHLSNDLVGNIPVGYLIWFVAIYNLSVFYFKQLYPRHQFIGFTLDEYIQFADKNNVYISHYQKEMIVRFWSILDNFFANHKNPPQIFLYHIPGRSVGNPDLNLGTGGLAKSFFIQLYPGAVFFMHPQTQIEGALAHEFGHHKELDPLDLVILNAVKQTVNQFYLFILLWMSTNNASLSVVITIITLTILYIFCTRGEMKLHYFYLLFTTINLIYLFQIIANGYIVQYLTFIVSITGLLILRKLFTQSCENLADAYAHRLGYGDFSIDFFKSLTGHDMYTRLKKNFNTSNLTTYIQDLLDNGHPSHTKRIQSIKQLSNTQCGSVIAIVIVSFLTILGVGSTYLLIQDMWHMITLFVLSITTLYHGLYSLSSPMTFPETEHRPGTITNIVNITLLCLVCVLNVNILPTTVCFVSVFLVGTHLLLEALSSTPITQYLRSITRPLVLLIPIVCILYIFF